MCGMANPSWSKAKYAARGVHLDQDTAGRLLESMGDHARREMIVRVTKVTRQNPAYRPFANHGATSGGIVSEVARFSKPRATKRARTMRRRTSSWHFLVCLLAACTASTVPQPGRPIPSPSLPNPVPVSSAAGPWTFTYAPGSIAYQISRSAGIESQSDSGSHRGVSTNTTHESLTLEPAGDTIHFSAIVDTFSTTTQGTIGPVQSVPLPVQLSGSFIGDSLIISVDSIAGKCNPVSSALSADLHNLLVRFPVQLLQGSSWRDSVELTACQGMIPTTAHIARSYIVSGETVYQGEPVLVIQRTDSIHAHGEGAQQQHRVILDASGTGGALYYVSPRDGRVVRVNTGQDLDLSITASGRINRFKQSSKQEFNFVR
jgi:hypothetical protein